MSQSITSFVRQPHVQVLANGAALSGVLSVQWSDPLVYNVGSFTIAKSFTPGDANGPAWWADTQQQADRHRNQTGVG